MRQSITTHRAENIYAALMAMAAIAVCALGAHVVGLDLAALLILIVPAAIMLMPARTVADVVFTARRGGLLAAMLLGAIRSAAEAGAALMAGAVLRALAPVLELVAAVFCCGTSAIVSLHRAAISAQDAGAQTRAQLGTIAATLADRVLPAPRAAALFRAA